MTIRLTFILILLSLVLFIPGIVKLSTTDRDGSRYAQASKQMLETGNYWQINFQNKPRHIKPPGIYWLQATSVKTLAHSNIHATWAYRVPSMLGAFLATLFTFLFGRRLLDDKTALLGAAFLITAFYVTLEAHMISTDAMLMACVAAMQGALWTIYSRDESQNGLAAVFWIAMAAGILIKGLAPLFAILTIIGLCIADRNISWLKRLKFSWGLPLMLALSIAWLIPISVGSHSNFLMNMIDQAVLPKLTGGTQGHGMPPGFFLITIGLLLWPGSLFLLHGIRRGFIFKNDRVYRFLLAWIIPS